MDDALVEGPALSAGAAARRLGVAVATLRSWDRRYGLGPRVHEPGAHRRYSPADMARLGALCRMVGEGVAVAEAARVLLAGDSADTVGPARNTGTAAYPARAGGGRTLPVGREGGPTARGLARCAIRLDTSGVLELLGAALARDGVVVAWCETIEPALRAVGRKWSETSGRYVEVEHLLSWCVAVALHRVSANGTAPASAQLRGRGVLLACTPEEWHSLPLEALAAGLVQRATPVRMLGPAVPGAAVTQAARRILPAHVVLWSHTSRTADSVTLARLGELQNVQVHAAGSGWLGRVPPGINVLGSLAQAVDACADPRTAG